MPSDQPIYGIKSRGQAGMEEFTRLEEMAACYLQEIRSFQRQGPYLFGGYCFGGNVAYEMARQLRAQTGETAVVLLIDSTPANAGYETAKWWSPRYAVRFGRNFSCWLKDFMDLSPDVRRQFISRKLRILGRSLARRAAKPGATQEVDLEAVIDPSHFRSEELKLWQAHLQALVEHVQQPYDGPVTLLRTRGQALFCSLEEDFCWHKLVPGGVKVRLVPGSHESIFVEPHVRELGGEVAKCLAEALAGDRPHDNPGQAEQGALARVKP
jgi:thioesterase domain-containing protein